MKIICHRGLWTKKIEQNSLKACLEGAKLFDGIEVDLKNQNGKIVLSHDPITKNNHAVSLESLFKKTPKTFFALNIKEDGLGRELRKLISRHKINNYMCFDLSFPESLQFQKEQLRVFPRMGDMDPKLKVFPKGLVIDVFDQTNYSQVLRSLKALKDPCELFFISPELHGHQVEVNWSKIKRFLTQSSHSAYLCTDRPADASQFFKYP
jgi:glycerophosphoryl diester phosphodiesterase